MLPYARRRWSLGLLLALAVVVAGCMAVPEGPEAAPTTNQPPSTVAPSPPPGMVAVQTFNWIDNMRTCSNENEVTLRLRNLGPGDVVDLNLEIKINGAGDDGKMETKATTVPLGYIKAYDEKEHTVRMLAGVDQCPEDDWRTIVIEARDGERLAGAFFGQFMT